MSAEQPKFLVVAELGFDHRMDAERCIEDMSHTCWTRCVSTHYKLYKEESDGHEDGIASTAERGNPA